MFASQIHAAHHVYKDIENIRRTQSVRRLNMMPAGSLPGLRQDTVFRGAWNRLRRYDAHRIYDSPQQSDEGREEIRVGDLGSKSHNGMQHHGLTTNATDDMLLSRMDGSTLSTNDAIFSDAAHARVPLLQKKGVISSRKVMTPPKTEVTSQHFGGALTTLVFGAALLSERLNGVGIVQNLELHNKGFHPVLLSAIMILLVASAWPEKREWKNPTLLVRIQMAGARFAYLGLAGSIAAEMVTGRGVLSLLDVETGIEAFSDVEAVLIFLTMLVLTGPQSREIS